MEEQMEENNVTAEPKPESQKIEFKKPVLIGRVGKLPKKAKSESEKIVEQKPVVKPPEEQSTGESSTAKSSLPPAVLLKELSTPIPYKEPKWSGLCPEGSDYGLEVLKSGVIVEHVDLTQKPYFVFGRLANSDVVMAHPTISRHHAVIQYKAFATDGEPSPGWYLYDLGSTHGTFLNKDKLKPSHYTRVRVGHQIKLGASTRTYIMLGPDFDCEGESDLTVSEIKQKAQEMKLERDRMIKEAIEQREMEKLKEDKRKEERGIDWGMGEDAEEEPDLAENPYASTANEELYLEDPKKTLRGYFEREGHELKYECDERGPGQFLCKVELPLDDARGRPIVAEVIHRGKKKEAVIACALEACRVLDRAGLLRQAKHESRARRSRDWAADDYYDSDDDNFLDRTGHVERKRQQRMRKHGSDTQKDDAPLTYDQLVKKIADTESLIALQEEDLACARAARKPVPRSESEDDLDAYMNSLKTQSTEEKMNISIIKMSIQKLKAELSKIQRLAEVARPAHLPPLIKRTDKQPALKLGANAVVYGKRLRLKEDAERHKKIKKVTKQEETEFVEEMDSDEEEQTNTQGNKDGETKQENNSPLPEATTSPKKIEKELKVTEKEVKNARVFGPMRPPENYVIPENYFEQESDRDLPNIEEKDSL